MERKRKRVLQRKRKRVLHAQKEIDRKREEERKEGRSHLAGHH